MGRILAASFRPPELVRKRSYSSTPTRRAGNGRETGRTEDSIYYDKTEMGLFQADFSPRVGRSLPEAVVTRLCVLGLGAWGASGGAVSH